MKTNVESRVFSITTLSATLPGAVSREKQGGEPHVVYTTTTASPHDTLKDQEVLGSQPWGGVGSHLLRSW